MQGTTCWNRSRLNIGCTKCLCQWFAAWNRTGFPVCFGRAGMCGKIAMGIGRWEICSCETVCPSIGDGISLYLFGCRNQSLCVAMRWRFAHVVQRAWATCLAGKSPATDDGMSRNRESDKRKGYLYVKEERQCHQCHQRYYQHQQRYH